MKTSELYFEPICIGGLVATILTLPWLPCLLEDGSTLESLSAVAAFGAIALGAAFLIGIPFDRLADTLSERLSQANRLCTALRGHIDEEFPKAEGKRLAADMFPENQYFAACIQKDGAVREWIDYHRSRIRLTRALAVYGPALTLMATIAMIQYTLPPVSAELFLVLVLAVYTAWALLALLGKSLPRTDDADLKDYAQKLGFLADTRVQRSDWAGSRAWLNEWLTLLCPLSLLAVSSSLAASWPGRSEPLVGAVALSGAALTVVSAWSWWRISFVYRGYLREFGAAKADQHRVRH